jgi:SAM-dependent methyltransferase
MINEYNNYLTLALGAGGQSKAKLEQFENNYTRFLPENKNAKALDIGPGKGEMLTYLDRHGFSNIEAVDISESVVEYVTQLGYQISLTDDLTSFLTEKADTFDIITVCDVVEHIPKKQILDVMSAIYNALKTNGILIVQVPNMQSITASIFRYDDFTHEMGYTERSLTQMLNICGFSSIQCFGFEFLSKSFVSKIKSVIRAIFWLFIKGMRKINGYMPHKIMHPVFFAVTIKC